MSNNSTELFPNAGPSQAILIFTITCLITASIAGILSSLLTFVVIIASKPLHTPCFILIAGSAIGSITIAAHFLVRSIKNILVQVGLMGFVRTGLQCILLDGVFRVTGVTFHGMVSCLIAIDRLISITAPFRYRNLGKKYALSLLGVCAIFAAIWESVGFFTASLYDPIHCTEFHEAMNPNFMSTFGALNLFFSTFNVAVYAAMLICFRYREHFSNDANDAFMKQQISVMPTIQLIALLYSFTGILGEILLNIGLATPMGSDAFLFLMNLGPILKDVSSSVEGLSLVIKSKKFRQCTRTLIGMKMTKVATIGSAKNVVPAS